MPKEEKKEIDLNAPITLTGADLVNLLTMMNKDNAKTLAEAFEKLSPTYKSPEQQQFTEEQRQVQRSIEINKLKNRKRTQRFCEHEQGQNGTDRNGKAAFHCLKLCTGELIGICTYCFKVISSVNPEDTKYFRKRSGAIAESGQFIMADPIKAQLARLSPDERARVIAAREKAEKEAPLLEDFEDELI
jgi:hypothetical protein